MRVLALCSYPIEAAASRYRLYQFVRPLRAVGIDLEIRPFLSSKQFAVLYDRKHWPQTLLGLVGSFIWRIVEALEARKYDVVLVQREAMLIGPPIIEWICRRVWCKPMVLDLDDATYIAYSSPTYGALASLVKCFGKTTDLLRWADVVTCGNEVIAKHAIAAGKNAMILPTTVDHNIFQPGPGRLAQPPVLGWIGTHSTYPFMEALLPTLEQLAEHHSFRVLIVGSGRAGARFKNLQVEFRDWSLTRETADFQSISIGLYPLEETPYANGKSGFKAIQYMMLGIPFVVSPVGICRTLGEPGRTHLLARTSDEWLEALKLLLCDTHRARLMGQAGRDFALRHYKLETLASTLGEALRVAATSNA